MRTAKTEYATFDPSTEELVCEDRYSDAVEAAEGTAREIWLLVDSRPVVALPDSFERLIICEDGQELRSAVIDRREVQAVEPIPRTDVTNLHGDELYGGAAPLLTWNDQNQTVQLRERVEENLERYTLLWPSERTTDED